MHRAISFVFTSHIAMRRYTVNIHTAFNITASVACSEDRNNRPARLFAIHTAVLMVLLAQNALNV
jgi:hypothetical protein